MIERVAKAIEDYDAGINQRARQRRIDIDRGLEVDTRDERLGRARAAIEAMRLPDHGEQLTVKSMLRLQRYTDAQRTFNGVIDGVLSEKRGEE